MAKKNAKKPFYKKWWVWLIAIIIVFGIIGTVTDDGQESEVVEPAQQTEPDAQEENQSAYTAENVYTWLKESNLITEDAEDKMDTYGNEEGIVNAIGNGEVHILEYEDESFVDASSEPTTLAHENIWILIIQGQSQYESFKEVLEAGKPITDLEESYASEEQKKVAELMENEVDFFEIVEAYYNLPSDQKSQTWDDFMYGNTVTWSGTIADLEAIGDSIVVYSGENYNGEDWKTISMEKKDMLPYTFIVELKDESQKNDLKQGDTVKINASLESRGDKEMQSNWKLYEGEVIK
ncbi:hypothetical protein D8M04_00735 [Oceanobacillus piezotolerans]|uniref:Uncharacterized protein n=1 Tax=Oceanobacillus piezotolerans TaxID=2448030 RepID=A0A498DH60_9BACI|nr:hypothetical protein [Oceanobacillus piezotolerans]RLL47839.1 hypothetical protein D8M04_00735 [Oceanobacillus piezotolerans]